MGPRSRDRGRHEPHANPSATIRLQWGRGHVTAEGPGRYHQGRARHWWLQWGRGHVTAEGKDPWDILDPIVLASMGPRSRDRGRGVLHSDIVMFATLQWGRGHVTAEGVARGSAWRFLGELQWGRGHVTAEGPMCLWTMIARSTLQWGRGHVTAEGRSADGTVPYFKAASMGPRSRDRGR